MANHLGKAVWRLSCVLFCHHLHSPIRCWSYRRRARLRPQQCGSATGIRILGGNLQGLLSCLVSYRNKGINLILSLTSRSA